MPTDTDSPTSISGTATRPPLSYQARAVSYFVGLILLTLIGASSVLFVAAKRSSGGLAERQLITADRVARNMLESNDRELRYAAAALATDSGFHAALASLDAPIIASTLENQRARLHADVFALLNDLGAVTASSDRAFESVTSEQLQAALERARRHDLSPTILQYRDKLIQVVILPLKSAEMTGWVCIGNLLNDAFVQKIKDLTTAEVSLVSTNSERMAVTASTLSDTDRSRLETLAAGIIGRDGAVHTEDLNGDAFLTLAVPGRNSLNDSLSLVLQMRLSAVTAPVNKLRRDMILIGGIVAMTCFILAVIVARRLAEPARALANAARSLSLSKRGRTAAAGDELAQVARAFHALAKRAHYDGLTGLPNRMLLDERLTDSIDKMAAKNLSLAVVFMDLNGFKKINDTLGHDLGDLVLRKTAQRLSRSVLAPHTIARLGGDEFVLVLENVSVAEAIDTVGRLSRLIATPMKSPGGPITVGMSAGIAMYPSMSHDRQRLLQLADAAMYLSKTRKTGPVLATVEPTTIPIQPPGREESPSPPDSMGHDSTGSIVWRGRDLATHNTKAISADVLIQVSARPAKIPDDEPARLLALRRLGLLDQPPMQAFDRVTRLAAKALNAPIALVSLVDEDRQWFMSRFGLNARQTSREVSFCAHAVFDRKPLVVADATQDVRFAGNSLVTGEPHIRAYAGSPVFAHSGYALGTLCVIDKNPRDFKDTDLDTLQDFAYLIEDLIHGRELRDMQRRVDSRSGSTEPVV